MLRSIRAAAADFTWLGDKDINERYQHFKNKVREVLSQRDSLFVQAGFLEKNRSDKSGPGVVTFDLLFSSLGFPPASRTASDLATASDRPMIELLNARAAKEQGRGEGQRLAEKSAASGLSVRELYDGEVAQGIDQLTVVSLGESAVSAIADALKNRSGKKK